MNKTLLATPTPPHPTHTGTKVHESWRRSTSRQPTTTTLRYNYNYNYRTLHPAAVGEETIATTPRSTTPTTFQSISGFALPFMHHNNSPPLQVPIFETSANALCGTTGNKERSIGQGKKLQEYRIRKKMQECLHPPLV